jgi:hypothetical protein
VLATKPVQRQSRAEQEREAKKAGIGKRAQILAARSVPWPGSALVCCNRLDHHRGAMNHRCRTRQHLGMVVSRELSACLPFALAGLLLPASALAAGNESESARLEREGKERAAKTACLSGDYATGVTLLAELFVSTNDITYLFNQGRCFEQNGKYTDAIVRFREYQRKNRSAGNAPDAEVERHIVECEALREREKRQATRATVPAAPPSQPRLATKLRSVTAAPVSESPVVVTAQPSTEPSNAGSGLRIAGITTLAVGVIGIGTGVFLNVAANDLVSELESSPTAYDRGKVSTQSSYETFAWLGYGAGAACVVGGVVLYYLGYRRGQTATTSLAFRPLLGQGELGAALKGEF